MLETFNKYIFKKRKGKETYFSTVLLEWIHISTTVTSISVNTIYQNAGDNQIYYFALQLPLTSVNWIGHLELFLFILLFAHLMFPLQRRWPMQNILVYWVNNWLTCRFIFSSWLSNKSQLLPIPCFSWNGKWGCEFYGGFCIVGLSPGMLLSPEKESVRR